MRRVDVVVPCYKYGHFLRGCVRSALTQQGVDMRVLIIDDASPDDSGEVAVRLAAEDSRVEVRRHAKNCGHINTYNEGLEWATGDYVLLLSADDLLPPGALGRAARLLDAHPGVGMVCGREVRFQTVLDLPEVDGALEGHAWHVIAGPEFLERSCRVGDNIVCTPSAVLRSRLQKAIGGFRKELPHTGDLEMWMRIAAHADIGYVDALQGFYRRHGRNMAVTTYGRAFAALDQRRLAFDTLFRTQATIRDANRLHEMAKKAIGETAVWEARRAFEGGDVAGCKQLLAFAYRHCTALRRSQEWRRLRVKALIGRRATSWLLPVVNWLRRGLRRSAISRT
jgi:glycosyltransferase involved in cell wall biosynthesis